MPLSGIFLLFLLNFFAFFVPPIRVWRVDGTHGWERRCVRLAAIIVARQMRVNIISLERQ